MSAVRGEALGTSRAARNLQDLHQLHKEEMMSYCFESKNQSLLGGQSPKQVVLTGRYTPLNIAENKEMKNEETEGSHNLEGTLSAALSQNQGTARIVVMQGPAGVGKTTALQKMLTDWSGTKHLQHFLFIFPFVLRGHHSEEGETSLEELLLKQHGHLSPESLALIVQSPQSLLFVFDGLEQYQHTLDVTSDSTFCTNVNQPCSLSMLLVSLMHRKLLPGASVLVTTRSEMNLNVFSEAGGHCVQVLGFSAHERKAYFHQVLNDPTVAERAVQHTEKNMGYYDVCSLPVFCWTLCSVLKEALEAEGDLPETLTQVYVNASVRLFSAHPLDGPAARTLLLNLGKMAIHCTVNNKMFCSQEDVIMFGFQPFLSSPLLSSFLSVDGDLAAANCVFSFLYPGVKEFFIALFYYLDASEEDSLHNMLGRLEGCVELVEVFLSGLSDAFQRKPLEGIVGKFNEDRIAGFSKWLTATTEEVAQSWNTSEHLSCFRLLHQSRNQALIKQMTSSPSNCFGMSYGHLTVWESVALNYIIVCAGGFEQVNLYSNRSVSEDIIQNLVPAISLSRIIILRQSCLNVGSYTHLASALHKGKSIELDLSYSYPKGDSGVKALCVGLRDCSLQTLGLVGCGLTEASCEDLASVLAEPTSQLQQLDLRGNELGDQGLIQLCQGLRSHHCKLQKLGITYCSLTGVSMDALAQAISDGSPQLTILCLDNNSITDEGMHWLTRALQNSTTNLQCLSVSSCDLTGACCGGLAELLQSGSCSLTELNLSCNELEDSGAVLLCEALKAQSCPLQILRLGCCELSEVTFRALGSVLSSGSSRLRELEVDVNKVGNEGVEHLWQGLMHEQCQLESLNLDMTGLSDACLPSIAAVLRANRRLKTLILKNNDLTDDSVPTLFQLMQESRTMKELNVQYNDFSENAIDILESCGRIRC